MNDYKHTHDTFSYEVKEHIGTFAEYSMETKELNLICYNGSKTPKYDIRTWRINSNNEKVLGKGLTLTEEEMKALKELVAQLKI